MNVGRYQILDTLGVGAHSRVARAFDPMIGRTVAIKMFPAEIAAGDARQRFLQEARVVGQLSHPNIVILHDMGVDELTSIPYLVMEAVEGQALNHILEKGSVPFQRACGWAADVATALAVAHRRGVIHGDIKPANILITEEGDVKLTDFGMARLASHDTKDSPLLGTPAYWCPEQIMGKPQDSRSDIFSLGVVLYEMITGRRAFEADSLQAVCSHILSSTLPSPAQSNSSIPAALNDVLATCLAKDPASRYQSAADLAAELYPLARHQTVEPLPMAKVPSSMRERAVRLLRSA